MRTYLLLLAEFYFFQQPISKKVAPRGFCFFAIYTSATSPPPAVSLTSQNVQHTYH